MAYENCLGCITLKASDEITTAKVAVKVSAANTMAVAGAADKAIGVLQDPVKAGEAGRVAVAGTTMVIAGAAISAGAFVKSGANGKVVTDSDGEGFGIALEAATAANDIISVLLK